MAPLASGVLTLSLAHPRVPASLLARSRRLVRRRELIRLAGTALIWPLAGRAEQAAWPVIGYLSNVGLPSAGRSFLHGLSEAGYVDGQNVTIAVRLAAERPDQLPRLAAELAR